MNQENLNRNLVNTARFPKALASIEETRDYMKPMRELTLFKDEIKKHTNIRTETFTGAELNKQRRCLRCKKRTHYGHTQRESRGQSQLCLDSFCYCDKDIIFRHSWLIGEDPWSKAKDRPCPLKISVLDGYKRGTLSHSKVAAPHDPISYINSMMKMENEVVDPQIDGSLHLYGHVHKDYRRTGEVYEDIEVYRVYEVYQFSDKAWKDAQSRIHVPSCIHHFGELKSSTWSCCQKSVYAEGCVKWLEHSKPRAWSYDEDESILYQTPECKRDPPNARSAVVLRCSMIQYLKVEPELLRLSAVDYYTGEILIDSLVSHGYGLDFTDPRSTGISLEMYHAAEERGETIWSRDAARSALWRIVGPRTRLIVYDGRADLLVLKWMHSRIIDAYELSTRRAGHELPRDLNRLAYRLLNRQLGQGGPDSLEQAFAIRDIVHWYTANMPVAVRREPKEFKWGVHCLRKVGYGSFHDEWRYISRIYLRRD